MKTTSEEFRVPAGKNVDLNKWPTRVKPVYKSKKNYHKLLEAQVEELSLLQRLHYASNGYAILLIVRGMDAAGKDGVIRQVMSGVNPQGCQVFSFKQPTAEELEYEERKLWTYYMRAYEACLSATSTKDAPWCVVPADDKKNARLIISEIILDVFNGLKLAYPKPGAKRRRDLQSIC